MSSVWKTAGQDNQVAYLAEGVSAASASDLLTVLLPNRGAAGRAAASAQPSVAIGVCTAFRPKMLETCLDAIGAQVAPAGVRIHVIVADNEPQASSEQMVRRFGARCPFSVHYIHEPRRGIPHARNAVLAKCRSLAVDWVAFTDDDCRVSPDWLASLLGAAARHQASVVYGRREMVISGPPPYWASHPQRNNSAEGQVLPYAATHNVLFKASLIGSGDDGGLAFDERLAHGEDTDFFHRATCRGARIVYSREPVVFETVSPERTTLAYQIRRAYHYAASRSYFHRRYKGPTSAGQKLAARWLFQVPLALIRLSMAPVAWHFSEPVFKTLMLKGTAALAGAVGAAAGILGRDGNPYRTIDGH